MSMFWRFLTVLLIVAFRMTFYCGLGFLSYAYFVQDHIDWGSAWFWSYLLVWPLILFGKFVVFAGYFAAVYLVPLIAVGAGIFYAATKLEDRKRQLKREAREAESRLRRGIIEH